MDSLRTKDSNCNGSAVIINQSTPAIMVGICSSNSFGIIPPTHHELISANSIELNAGASLSDDSGVPLTTNSSISSGDSFRLGICKFEIEMVESDGEVSQFDSLDNCSEGGMSAENFNTLKKGPLPPIDPPPQFQDSPQTTLIRSVSNNIVNTVRRWSLSQSSFEHIKETNENIRRDKSHENCSLNESDTVKYSNRILRDSYAVNKHLYSSDSILNTYTDNIYDEPNNIISSSLGTSIDVIDSDSSSPIPPPIPSTLINVKQSLCPYYQDHSRYFKAIPSDQDNIPITAQKFNVAGLSEIHDYDLYYGAKKTTYQYDNSLQRKLLYSPLNHSYHYNSHHYTGIGSCGNRPNSRNSLCSRLSSSHNSLGISNSNKADDSIFITQAMSHDALLTREISDFYNVPIDSDIYAFPIDMISSDRESNIQAESFPTDNREKKIFAHTKEDVAERKCHHQKSVHKSNRNKRRKRTSNNLNNVNEKLKRQPQPSPKTSTKTVDGTLNSRNTSTEPLHMTLDEVKQFYHTLYSDTKEMCDERSNNGKTFGIISSNETIWSFSSSHSKTNCKLSNVRDDIIKQSLTENSNTLYAKNNRLTSDSENINNNNNNITASNHNSQQQQVSPIDPQPTQGQSSQQRQSTTNNKLTLQSEKKSQFTLNLKQKFCSIFRFRKNPNRCRGNSTDSDEYISNAARTSHQSQSTENKRNKFQSRALPPLPKKTEAKQQVYCEKTEKKPEFQSFHFTSSIEKVKDYGWYWGPLSSEAAEKVLSNEPDGSFIVRDSSDDHYIFSLSFKLNNCVRHVRIEQDQGTFSFGSYAKFKSQTITEFIEKAVEHSRSGRYLFFLHRRPEHGPMRVQLTNPVSRFKHVQSLQHMCRFVILKVVIRKDLIQTLPLPRRLLDYLNYKHYFSEQVESDSSHSQVSGEGSV